jgi:hypothetical protein
MIQHNIAQSASVILTARSISSGQQPDLKGIGIQLLESLLIPIPVVILLAGIMHALFRWFESCRAARKSAESLFEEGEAMEAPQLQRYTSPHFKHPDVNGHSSIDAILVVSVYDFALASPPRIPNLPAADRSLDVPTMDLCESVVTSGGVSAIDFAYRVTHLPPTPYLRGFEELDEIERLDIRESRFAK